MTKTTFFGDSTNKFYYEGEEVGILKKGDTQTDINFKIASELEALRKMISDIPKANPANSSSVKNDSNFGVYKSETDSGEKLLVKVEPKDNNVYVSYEYKMLDTDEKVSSNVSVEGLRNGLNSVLLDSDKLSNGFYLNPDNFPASLNFEVMVKRNGNNEKLTSKIQLNPSGGEGMYSIYKRNINGSNLETQKEVNDFFHQEVSRINKVLNDRTVNIEGSNKSIDEAFSDVISMIKAISSTSVV